MKKRTANALLKGTKGFRVLYLPADVVYVGGRGDALPAEAPRPALTPGAAANGRAGSAAAPAPLGDAAAVKESFLDKALDAYEVSYKELAANWRGLEVKAQGSITVAGVFIAASFAFLQRLTPELHDYEKVVLGLALLLLVASVLLAVRVLTVKSVPAPIFGDRIGRYAKSLHGVSDEAQFPQYALWTYETYFNEWEKVIAATQKLTLDKAGRLSQAQWFLQAAVVAAALLALIRVIVAKAPTGAGG